MINTEENIILRTAFKETKNPVGTLWFLKTDKERLYVHWQSKERWYDNCSRDVTNKPKNIILSIDCENIIISLELTFDWRNMTVL